VHLDRNNLHPTGQFERDFVEGFPVPDRYLSIPEGEPWRVHIDFQRWALDLQLAADDYQRRLQSTMQQLYGADAVDRVPTKEAIKRAGSKPEPVELVLLFAHGDRWCLGLQTEPTAAVKAVLKDADQYRRYVLKKRPVRGVKGTVDVRENGLALPQKLQRLLEEEGAATRIADPAEQRKAAWEQSLRDVRVESGEIDDETIVP
jgi:hypothetical protein